MPTLNACPRRGCGGSMVADWHGGMACTLCARAERGARPPTAEELRSRGSGMVTETNYQKGIYRIGYIPTIDELTRADW